MKKPTASPFVIPIPLSKQTASTPKHTDQPTESPDMAASGGAMPERPVKAYQSIEEALSLSPHEGITVDLVGEEPSLEVRSLDEIQDASGLFWNQVWYNRFRNRRCGVEDGSIRIVTVETDADRKGKRERTVQRDIWQGALANAQRIEEEYGRANLGPWTDFEWGMINGKLSALNWVLGDEWDMLDT